MAEPARHGTRRSRPLRLLVLVLLAVVLLVGLDRLAASLAARRLAANVQTSQRLSDRPDVTIRGFPFVTQVLRGSYGRVDLRSRGPIGRDGIEVSSASAELRGVRVHAGQALRGTVEDVPVASGTGSALVTYPELNALLARYGGLVGSAVSIRGTTPGRARVDGPLGLTLDVAASVTDGRLVVVPDPAGLAALPAPVRDVIARSVAAPIPLPAIPFNVRLASGRLEPEGLVLSAVARDSVFPVR